MPVYLGRGHSQLTFHDTTVEKIAPWSEASMMRLYPDVFVEVLKIETEALGTVKMTMPRLNVPVPGVDTRTGLLAGLERLRALWALPDISLNILGLNWRTRLHTHLTERVTKYHLEIPLGKVDSLVRKLPDVKQHVVVHGDPTLANIIHDVSTDRWWWIDPLIRLYIPGDPHVDLGKMFQSCWGYEEILTSKTAIPRWDASLALELTKASGLDMQIGKQWCLIHLIRLLPYQDERVRSMFETLLQRELT